MELLKLEFIFVVLLIVELIYFRLAGRLGIIDKPNSRSSHDEVTLRGGGVVFYVAAIAYFFVIGFYYPWTMLGLTIVAAVSFADDIKSLPDSVRLAAQFVGVLLALYEFGGVYTFGWWWLIPALIIGVGVLNAFNFMDGINGLTGGYSLVVLSALLYVNNYVDKFVDNRLLGVMLCACLVFCFFNFRSKATCFAGDVGAVSIALIIVSLLAKLMMRTGTMGWIAFLAVYGVDVVLTIVHRVMLHENIGKAHRKHMYQIMANELKIPHTDVASIYMAVQALVCMIYLLLPSVWTAFWLVVLLSVVYILFMRKYYHLHAEYLASVADDGSGRRNVSFSPPDMTEAEVQQVADTLRNGWITTGPKTKEFERRIAEYCHTEKAVCLNSATACMESILRVLGVGPGDEVITCAYTYTASASVACHVGAKVVLVDAQKDSVEMDYDQLEAAITERTKVVIPVDLGGIVCDYDRIFAAVERKRHLFRPANEIQKLFGRAIVLADAAHAFGAQWHGKMCGEIADFTSFSFHAVKNLTTAEGGALTWHLPFGDEPVLVSGFKVQEVQSPSDVQSSGAAVQEVQGAFGTGSNVALQRSNVQGVQGSGAAVQAPEVQKQQGCGSSWNEKLYKEFQLLSLHGQNKDALAKTKLGAWEYDIVAPYYKCNMTDIMAGIGLAQLERYPQLLARRKEIVKRYDDALKDLNVKVLEHYGDDHQGSGHLYIVRMLGLTPEQRNEVIVKMAERGVACNVHYKPLPMMTAYKAMGYDIKDYPNAYHLFENEITLPLHTKLTDEDVEYVIACFKEALREVKIGLNG